jgi:hypothetical protein
MGGRMSRFGFIAKVEPTPVNLLMEAIEDYY